VRSDCVAAEKFPIKSNRMKVFWFFFSKKNALSFFEILALLHPNRPIPWFVSATP
jgi:hypothetical protein